MNGARGFGGGARRKIDRRTRAATTRRTAKQKNAPGREEGSPARRGGEGREGPPQTQEPREGVPRSSREEPAAVPRPPGAARADSGPGLCFSVAPRAWQAGCRPASSGTLHAARGGTCLQQVRAERPVLTAGPLRGRAGGPPAPSPWSPTASALSSGRLSPGSHAHWLWTSLFLADHLPAFPGLSGIPSNSKHFLSSAGLRSESLTVARSCQQSWPGEGLRPCPWSLVCLPPPRQPLRGFPEAQGLPARPLPLGCPCREAWPARTHLAHTVGSWRPGGGGGAHCTSL